MTTQNTTTDTLLEYYLNQATTPLTETQLTHLCFYTDYRTAQHNNTPLTDLTYERAPYRITSPTISTHLNNNPTITTTDNGYTYTGSGEFDSTLTDFLDTVFEEVLTSPDWQSLHTFCLTTNTAVSADTTITFNTPLEPWILSDMQRGERV